MRKILVLSFVTASLIANTSMNDITTKHPPLKIKGKIVMERHPLPFNVLSQESGGLLTAEEAYSDGVGVMLVESPYIHEFPIDYSPLNILVQKYGEEAADSGLSLKDYVLTNITDPEDIKLAQLLEDAGEFIPDLSEEFVMYGGHLYCYGATPGQTVTVTEEINGVQPNDYYVAIGVSDIRAKIAEGFTANNICTSHVTDMRNALSIYNPNWSINNYFKTFNGNISSWDTSNVTNMRSMFNEAELFNQAINFDTSNVTNMSGMFSRASSFNKPVNFDTSKVTNMHGMFSMASAFNQEVKFTDTSKVTAISSMFFQATNFNQPVNFNTSNVTNMYSMFEGATNFNEQVNFTDTSNVTNMSGMFYQATNFNQPLNFDTSNVINMRRLFGMAINFNQSLNFDTSKVIDMSQMFWSANAFNQPVNFDTSKVTNMSNMFYDARAFNQPINFDTSNVTNMSYMFGVLAEFNQPLNFDTSNVTDMAYMFYAAFKFNQNISNWNVIKIPTKPNNFDLSTPAWIKTGRQPIWGTTGN